MLEMARAGQRAWLLNHESGAESANGEVVLGPREEDETVGAGVRPILGECGGLDRTRDQDQ
jgi:hypothetical protein